jgi:hypothetical protein
MSLTRTLRTITLKTSEEKVLKAQRELVSRGTPWVATGFQPVHGSSRSALSTMWETKSYCGLILGNRCRPPTPMLS